MELHLQPMDVVRQTTTGTTGLLDLTLGLPGEASGWPRLLETTTRLRQTHSRPSQFDMPMTLDDAKASSSALSVPFRQMGMSQYVSSFQACHFHARYQLRMYQTNEQIQFGVGLRNKRISQG